MAARTTRRLTPRQLNRAVLARQHLLRRSTASLPATLEAVAGLQMQYAPSGYVGCWSRLAGVSRARITRALERRQIVQATLLRSTIHLVSAADYAPLFEATRAARQENALRVARSRELDEVDYGAVAAVVRGWFADGPLERADVLDRLAAHGIGRQHWEILSQWLELLRLPPQGTWERRRAHRYGLARRELAAREPVDPEAGLRLLVERYLGAFGPASRDDLASWAGMPVGAFDPVLGAVAPARRAIRTAGRGEVPGQIALRRFVDSDGGELIDLPRRPLPAASTVAPVRFLGTWDATLLVHARRTQILPERYRGVVFSVRRPHSVNTLLVDGQIAGTWKVDGPRVVIDAFEGIPSRYADQVEDERRALQSFIR